MGLENKHHEGGTKYVSIVNSMFSVRCSPDDEGAEERTTKSGKTVWEQKFSDLSGFITGMRKKETEFEGKKIITWVVYIEDGLDHYALEVPYTGRESRALLSRLPNINLSDQVALRVGKIKDKESGKLISFMTVSQGGNRVPQAFTKDAPNGLPPLKKVKVKGVETWDDSDQMEFYEALVKKLFDNLKAEEPKQTSVQTEDDDLPF